MQDLNSILCEIDSMQQTVRFLPGLSHSACVCPETRGCVCQVTRIYLCIHKRQILRSISTGIEKIDIAEMEKIAKEDTDKLEHQLLFDNVQTVQKLNISVSFFCIGCICVMILTLVTGRYNHKCSRAS